MSSGFLDTDAASGYVSSTFADATNKASSAFSSSMTLINQLAALPDIDAPSITAPTAPATPELTNQPEAPTINTPHLGTISIDEAPVLDSLDLPDVVIPDFTATAPTISISDKPELDEPEAPGTTPSWEDISLPGEPDIILPTVPTLDPVDIPNFDIFIRTSFEGDRPAAPMFEAPGRLYLYQEGEFSSDLQDAIEQQIYDGLLAGGDIKAIAGMERLSQESQAVPDVEPPTVQDMRDFYAGKDKTEGQLVREYQEQRQRGADAEYGKSLSQLWNFLRGRVDAKSISDHYGSAVLENLRSLAPRDIFKSRNNGGTGWDKLEQEAKSQGIIAPDVDLLDVLQANVTNKEQAQRDRINGANDVWQRDMQHIQEATDYATFDVVKYIDEAFGPGIGAKIHRQIGTTEAIGNPYTATLSKDLSMTFSPMSLEGTE